jgi:hypothetical protein
MLTNPTLAELAAAQQENTIYAFSLGQEVRQVTRLRAIHTKKLAELEALDALFEETKPDFVLRSADGSEIVLRLPLAETCDAYDVLRQALETGLRKLKEGIVHFLLLEQQDAELAERKVSHEPDLRPAILALCQLTSPSPDIQEAQTRTARALTPAA